MASEDQKTEKVALFYAYTREDRSLRDQLERHLTNLKYQGSVDHWHDQDIQAGGEWKQQINAYVNGADIILLLVSANFLASGFCESEEMKSAFEKSKAGDIHMLPILLRPVVWTNAPFAHLSVLPKNKRAVVQWRVRDEAFVDIAQEIERVARNIWVRKALAKGDTKSVFSGILGLLTQWKELSPEAYHKRSLATYNKALLVNPYDSTLHANRGYVLVQLEQYEEALIAYEKALRFNPRNLPALVGIVPVHAQLGHYEESLAACEQALRLDPHDAATYRGKASTLSNLGRYKESLAACEQALRLDPHDATTYGLKAYAFAEYGQAEDALVALRQAFRLESDNANVANAAGLVYQALHNRKKALAYYQESVRLKPNWQPYYNIVNTLMDLKRYREAIAFSDRALGLAPYSAWCYHQRGKLLDQLGRSWQSERFHKRAKQLGYYQ